MIISLLFSLSSRRALTSNQRSARILDPGNSRRESASFFLARPREMIFWSLDLVSKHESNKMESRSRLEIWEWSYDNLDLVSPGESKKNNSQSRLEKLHFFLKVRVRLQPNYRAVHCTEGNHMMWFLINNFFWCSVVFERPTPNPKLSAAVCVWSIIDACF